MKDFKIHIDENLDSKSKKIVDDYWLIQNSVFLYKASEIIQMHNITQGDLNKLVKKHSYCEINHGNCQECNEEMKVKICSKTDFNSTMRDKIHTCSECRIELRRKSEKEYQDKLEEIRKRKLAYFDKAVNEKKWIELSKNELNLLYKLIENKTKSKIYANVFEGDSHSRSTWGYVNKFEGMGLLSVIRNGRSEMGRITGTGCQLSGITTAFLAANPKRKLEAAVAAVCMMGVAGEIAWTRMQEGDGNATYRNRIIDAIYNMTGEKLEKGAKYELY